MSSVDCQFFVPQAPLSNFVAVFWYWSGYESGSGKERVLPTGTTELVISLENPGSSVVSGPHSEPFVLERSDRDTVIGIHFHPGGSFPFLGLPSCELQNQDVSLEDLWSDSVESLQSDLMSAKEVHHKFKILHDWLLARMKLPLLRHRAVDFALNHLKGNDEFKISHLADEVNLSQRRFIEVFAREVGLAPKMFGRLMRFQRSILALEKDGELDLADVALSQGYYDQAHFIHEFKDFSGFTPTEYLRRRTNHLYHVRA